MRSEAKLFNGLTLFLFIMAAVYGVWTYNSVEHTEWVGVTALVMSGLLTGMIGQYFSFVARRIDARPEDREDADISEGAGELGFFSPGSYWPFTLAASASIAGIGIVFWMPWLMVIGGVMILLSVGGLLFEYYSSSRQEAH